MMSASDIALGGDSRRKTQSARCLHLRFGSGRASTCCLLFSVLCLLLSACLSGCARPKNDPPVWENVKLKDLAPSKGGVRPSQRVKTINLDLHVFEVPAENVDKLDKIRKKLYVRPLRLRDYGAFYANSFWVRFGQPRMWNEVYGMVQAAAGQRVNRISLMLPEDWPETVTITGSERPQSVSYTGLNGSKEVANVGPGILGLRITAKSTSGLPDRCTVTAYPVFTPPVQGPVPALETQAKLREFPFTVAAFGLDMRPGQFIVLAPTKYVEDLTTLGGLFFSNPQGSLFLDDADQTLPERKPTVRVFLLICTRIDS